MQVAVKETRKHVDKSSQVQIEKKYIFISSQTFDSKVIKKLAIK